MTFSLTKESVGLKLTRADQISIALNNVGSKFNDM